MFKIAICEDDKDYANHLCTTLFEILEKEEIVHTIDSFYSADAILKSFKLEKNKYQLFIMDILLGHQNGFKVTQQIRDLGYDGNIIFLTCCKDFIKYGYYVGAKRYLVKPVKTKELSEAILSAYNDTCPKCITLSNSMGVRPVEINDVWYLESKGHKIIIHTNTEEIVWLGRLQDFEDQLPSNNFLRCHKSFLVNSSKVEFVKSYKIFLKNGKTLPISKTYSKRTTEKFIHYLQSN